MEDQTPGSPTEDDFELVTRKKKGRNSKYRPHFSAYKNTRTQNSGPNSRQNSATVIYGVPFEERSPVSSMTKDYMNLIQTDASVIRPPQYEEQNEETKKEEEETVTTPEESPEIQFQININEKALSKYAKSYELEKFEKNALLIFNHRDLDGYSPRLGTEKDVAELVKTFRKFNFEVAVENDLRRDEIMERLQAFTSRDFTDYGCVCIAVLTHGSRDGRIKAKDVAYSELEIVRYLQVRDKPTLVTKPRILIIQACRGTKSVQGVIVGERFRIQTDLEEEFEPYTLPVESDMLVLHSSYIGKVSHRHELDGSWFIQTLCSKINELAAVLDLEAILTEVKREVAINKEHTVWNRRTYEDDTNKQMPVSTSTLTRRLYLRKSGDAPQGSDIQLNAPSQAPGPSSHTEVDNSNPNTPLLVQYGPCACFLDHFSYIKECLSHYVAENPNDSLGQSYLNLANTYEDGDIFNRAKEEMAKCICNHLKNSCQETSYYKYLYFYKH